MCLQKRGQEEVALCVAKISTLVIPAGVTHCLVQLTRAEVLAGNKGGAVVLISFVCL